MKRTGVARAPLRRGEKLREKIEAQLGANQAHATVDTVILQGAECLLYYRLVSNAQRDNNAFTLGADAVLTF